MSPLIVGAFAVATFAISAWLTRLFCNPASAVYVLDRPNERSLHDRAVSRGGGLAILLAILVGGLGAAWFHSAAELAGLAFGVILVGCMSFLDDHYSIPPLYRLLTHIVAVAVFLYQDYVLESLVIPGASLDWSYGAAAAFSLLFCVWLINLYNFMDGMDGFAGGMAVFGFGCFAIMGWLAGHGLFFVMSLVIASASAGFLVFNFPPARIFMGDTGSSTLGFLAAAFSLWGARDGMFPFWVAILIFSPFIADASVTLARRMFRGEKIWQAHKTHYYQKLVQTGWGHRKTVLIEYAIMMSCGISALLSQYVTSMLQTIMLAGWVLFYVVFFSWISWYSSRRRQGQL